jgi:hypothetical protein
MVLNASKHLTFCSSISMPRVSNFPYLYISCITSVSPASYRTTFIHTCPSPSPRCARSGQVQSETGPPALNFSTYRNPNPNAAHVRLVRSTQFPSSSARGVPLQQSARVIYGLKNHGEQSARHRKVPKIRPLRNLARLGGARVCDPGRGGDHVSERRSTPSLYQSPISHPLQFYHQIQSLSPTYSLPRLRALYARVGARRVTDLWIIAFRVGRDVWHGRHRR